MSAKILQAACSYCSGSGKAESLMERSFTGEWVPNRMLCHELADAWIASDKAAPLRWDACDCPICAGTGRYELESVPCRIF